MDSEPVLQRFDDLGIWKQGDQRAPHKPLLVLYALGRWQAGWPISIRVNESTDGASHPMGRGQPL